MSKLGCSVYLIPERAAYGVKPKDAVVNGMLFEFRTVTGKPNTFHRIWLVLKRHPEYTGEIIISFNNGNRTYFWNTENLR